uniref:Uncharacterized protein n=1 Tax=Arundo donax TaxID=35708 RepID=A0A0A9C0N6_ARUDO
MAITSLDWLVGEANNFWELRREMENAGILLDRESSCY